MLIPDESMLPYLAGAIVLLMVVVLYVILRRLGREAKVREEITSRMESTAIRREITAKPETPPPAPRPAPLPTPPDATKIPFAREEHSGDENRHPSEEYRKVEELEQHDPAAAAGEWHRLTRWPEAARAHRKAGQLTEATRILLALERTGEALDVLGELRREAPGDEAVALATVEALVESGQYEEAARQLARLLGDGAPGHQTPDFFHAAGVIYESVRDYERALGLYRQALEAGGDPEKLRPRIDFASQLLRLASGPVPDRKRNSSAAMEMLERYILESTSELEAGEGDLEPPPGPDEYGMIVGHLALGFEEHETRVRPRSVYSLVRRFELKRLVSESSAGATFEARDRLLDVPLALKLHRLTEGGAALEILEKRLRAIARLNHPNLAKVAFADRTGPILRIATEYLPGGNLRDYLRKMGGAGYPLIIRMALHMASALHAAHLRGIPHGDLRPENIAIGPDQRLKLADFALSPIPITRMPDFDSREIPPDPDASAHRNDGVNSDLLQMGELIEFMLENAREVRTPASITPAGGIDPAAELREVAERIRRGSFGSAISLWQVLDRLFEQTLPAEPTPPTGSALGPHTT